MNRRIVSILCVVCICCAFFLFGGCSSQNAEDTGISSADSTLSASPCSIYLYGEQHSNADIYEIELTLWQEYYHEYGIRHLFVEYPYYTAQYLNLWMNSEADTILYEVYADWEGTQGYSEEALNFLKSIKETCPETVFHGTDVGHQYDSTGYRYRDYLAARGLADTEDYRKTTEAIEQGVTYYQYASNRQTGREIYRENTMTANFIREFDALGNESVMGIYGSAHIGLDSLNHSGECDSMGKQLYAVYGDQLTSQDLQQTLLDSKIPERIDTLEILGKRYTAEYFGKSDLSAVFPEYSHREFWHLIDASEVFTQYSFTGNFLPQSNYPMRITAGEVYIVRYTLADGSERTEYHVCDGSEYNGTIITYEVNIDSE